MSDGSGKDPLQWWPCTVEAPLATGLMPNTHPLVYHVLRSRGYKEETHSRCRFERPLGGSGSNGNGHNKLLLPDGANGRLLDVDEGLWRPWRFCAVCKSNKPPPPPPHQPHGLWPQQPPPPPPPPPLAPDCRLPPPPPSPPRHALSHWHLCPPPPAPPHLNVCRPDACRERH